MGDMKTIFKTKRTKLFSAAWLQLKNLVLKQLCADNTPTSAEGISLRNQYQLLLQEGTLSDIIILKVEKMKNTLMPGNEMLSIKYKVPGEHAEKIHLATTFTAPGNIPDSNSLVPAFHNSFASKILVLLQ
jgi:hypothetical protein